MFGITFVTDKGTRSPQLGGHGGSKTSTYMVPVGQRLAGIFGRMDPKINDLGFYLAPARKRINRRLPAYGVNDFGFRFSWVAKDNSASLESIEAKAGIGIDRIKFYMNNREASSMFGYFGRTRNQVIPAGQHIVSATFNTYKWLHSVTFRTNEGQ